MSEETEQKEELSREGIPVPIYFDRYVASELRALGQQIVALKDSMDERFDQVDKRFDKVDEIDKQSDKYDTNIKWIIGLSLFVNVCVLALVIKVFFFGPLN